MKTTLTIDEKAMISDSMDAVRAAKKLMQAVVDRYVEKLLTESLDGTKLVMLRANIDGMKALIYEYEQALKNNRS
jgi:hypothetical protein